MHNTVYTIGNNKDLLHSTGNYTLYLIIIYTGKNKAISHKKKTINEK